MMKPVQNRSKTKIIANIKNMNSIINTITYVKLFKLNTKSSLNKFNKIKV